MDFVLWGAYFFAGLLSFFSPCIAIISSLFGVLMSEQEGKR